ncbi:uncharacterized protein LOC135149689 [Daucus carota subsp. sativus]|uniref:uncharacterized protein LOC135149689 n=1 Tax=Daucus carota subsp. sativus TaxID=79200 RepID=UPI003083AE23
MSLINSCKPKFENDATDGSISSQRSKSNPTIQFFVKLFSEMETLVIRADVNDTIEHVLDLIQSKSGIPLNGQPLIYKSKQLYPEQTLGQCCVENDAVLQVVGVMPSTRHVRAQQTSDEIVSLIWRLCKRNPGNKSWDSEARYLIRRNLTDYFTDLLSSDNDMAIGDLQVFSYSGAPAALAMLYMSPDHMIFGDELIRQLVWVIAFMPPYSFQQCVPILLEICKPLRGMPYYGENVIFDTCRTCLSSMVACIEIEAASDGGSVTLI